MMERHRPPIDRPPETTGLALLEAAEATLSREVAPLLTGEARFKALMAASALRMVMREFAAAGALEAAAARLGGHDQRALARGLREGRHDADAAIHAALMADARARTAVSRPEAVTPRQT